MPALLSIRPPSLRLLAAITLFAPALATAAELDIAGLRLGMSPDEARQALIAYGVPTDKIQEARASFWFMDGDKRHETAEFIDRINGNKDVLKDGRWVRDAFELRFAPPPEGGALVRIRRQVENSVDAPTAGDYRSALQAKYGPPDQDKFGVLLWMRGPGKGECKPQGKGDDGGAYVKGVYRSIRGRVSLEHPVNPRLVRGPEDCAVTMSYTIGTMDAQPAKRVSAELVDPGAWVKAHLAAMAEVARQQEAAVKTRDAGASKPTL